MVAAKIANLKHVAKRGEQAANLPLEPEIVSVTQAAAAKMLNVSERTVRDAAAVRREGSPEVISAVEAGRLAVSAAVDLLNLPPAEQRKILDAASKIRTVRADVKRAQRDERLTALSRRNEPLPNRRYPIILADPPVKDDLSASDSRLGLAGRHRRITVRNSRRRSSRPVPGS